MRLRLVEPERSFAVDLSVGSTVVLGRQTEREMQQYHVPFMVQPAAGGLSQRLVLAWGAEFKEVSQEHLELKAIAEGRVRLTNRSKRLDVLIGDRTLRPGEADDLLVPFTIRLPRRTLVVELEEAHHSRLDWETYRLPVDEVPLSQAVGLQPPPNMSGNETDHLIDWLQATLSVLQGAIGSTNFLHRAVEALVEIVGLESGWVLLCADGRWEDVPVVCYPSGDRARGWRPSKTVLQSILRKRQIF
jgi:hypothetical protein